MSKTPAVARALPPDPRRTPLMEAVLAGKSDVVDRWLRASPAPDVAATDSQGNTALHYTQMAPRLATSHWLAMAFLLRDGASPAAANHAGKTPLHLALEFLHRHQAPNIRPIDRGMAQELIDIGAPLDAPDAQGRTPADLILGLGEVFDPGVKARARGAQLACALPSPFPRPWGERL